ncbi:liprin-beta-2 isoform X1 [Gallus gallus]|uniref:liprin-beta-2 isoform X1 n=3 Tax=Gallus gallus TaxID=9031 RepID=UPI001AEA0C7C|nr:liprin-beta-2 isoform X1 [Gallus gallus]XP_040529389.1 liprin-beta-2 isoform X1 [Gallus gallus]XP_040529390.1 liprin-beta-2 isoform X1 [Gallus gallus]XP_040529392.1 liprin-beta-2 isoform X1 [Gallus gallus]XP_040529393.1 liprin-beta-2 isoform X1 [Gallus gallus]XP_040529394.1 liprin-beta-2 isoform X1 [Gallus gallus]XP_046775255.1 liprin-beta-2 isoform X1 [Gallus gallus]
MASDASHMLEAALEQMDDIIAGTKSAAEYANGAYDIVSPAPSVYLGTFQILHLLEDLKMALEMLEDPQEKEALRNQIPGATAVCIREWFEENLSQVNHHSSTNNETYQERLARLEGDKESLILQVSVLTDQVEAQGEKIRDLEICLEGHQLKLNATEEMLQQELLSRTSLETQKLDLMAEVSDLKIKLVGMEKEQSEYEEKQNKAESVVNLISELQEQMCRLQLEINSRIQERKSQDRKSSVTPNGPQSSPRSVVETLGQKNCSQCDGLLQELRHLKIKVEELENERNQYEWKLKATKAEIAQLQEQLALKDAEIERLQCQLSRTSSHSEVAEREEVYKRRLKEKRKPCNSLVAFSHCSFHTNDQEVQRLKIGMESLLAANEEKDRRIEELTLLLSQYRRVKEIMIAAQGSSDRIVSGGSEEELEATLRKLNVLSNPQGELFKAEASSGELSPALLSPVMHKTTEIRVPQKKKSSSLEDLQSESLEKYVDGKPVQPVVEQESKPLVKGSKYQTLPGKLPRPTQNGDQGTYNETNSPDMNDTEDSSILGLRETENTDGTVVSDDLSPLSSGTDSGPQSPLSLENRKSPKGIKKIWGKIRRTQSGNFPADDLGLAEFRRGGLRATAGPRLSRSKETKGQKNDYNAPFAQWSTERVCNWLEDFGLGQYVIFARQWVTSGHTLLTATPQDMEKEMGIKHPLHRKKLVLAIKSISTKQDEKSAQLDHIWVTRWLDDIGLPQYKDQFHESRVDGRMLQYLTVNDLLFLKVTSQLHHLSIKCAIHVLHINNFNPHCLRRRPVEEVKSNVPPSEVVQWSNHRVMEWLRSVDLAEYAPNLRGSGVHGGLIILEPRFNGDTLAMLLNIPPQKTLLRRHLTTNFNVLIGPETQQEKRDITESTAYTPLTTTAKVRPKKLGFSHFGNLRKKKFDESTDYVCPMDTNPGATNGTQKNYTGYKGLSPLTDRELDQMEHSEGTVKQIGAFSQGISNLTVCTNFIPFEVTNVFCYNSVKFGCCWWW